MGWFSTKKASSSTKSADSEKEETAKAKARLLETEGKNNGAELSSGNSQSIRRIFG